MAHDFGPLFTKAKAAAITASLRWKRDHGDHDACGFAWVTVHPANHPFVNWIKKNIDGGPSRRGSKGWKGGWVFWNPGEFAGQSISGIEAGAEAFAATLKEAGIVANWASRLD